MSAIIDASVIICTHNPRPHYLRRVLIALHGQTLPMERWELLVVDNASEEPLTALAWGLSWHPHAQLIREEQLGLSAARMRGMREAAAALVVFVDDDNLLDPTYLAEALRIGSEWPQLGVWGGSIIPEFEIEPPEHLREFLGALALRDVKTPRWTNVMPCYDATPWGAGLCVRSSVARAYLGHCEKTALPISDRSGKSLISGGDVELSYVAGRLGLGMGVFPDLKVVHLIPKERINDDYLLSLCQGIATSGALLAYKWLGQYPRSFVTGLGLLHFIRNFIRYRGIRRRMFLAEVRAVATAKRLIAANKSRSPNAAANSEIFSP